MACLFTIVATIKERQMIKHLEDSDLSNSMRLLIGYQMCQAREGSHRFGQRQASQTQGSPFHQISDCSGQIDHFHQPRLLSQVATSIATATIAIIAEGWQRLDQIRNDFNLKMMELTGKIQKQPSQMVKYCREVKTRKNQRNCCSCLVQQKDHFVEVSTEVVAITEMIFLGH